MLFRPSLFFKGAALACAFLPGFAQPAWSAEKAAPEQVKALPEVVVTAAAEPAEVRKLPSTVQVITAETLERTGAETLSDVIERYVPGNGTVQPGAYSSVGMRGFRSYKSAGISLRDGVLLLIDGHRAGTGNPAAIPMGNVERVEIVRGPSSVLYGGSAMGGVVNVITKRGRGPVTGSVGASYGRFDRRAADASISGGAAGDRFGYAVGIQGAASSSYKDGDGDRYKNSGFHNAGAGASLTWRPSEDSSLSLVGAHQSIFDTGSPGGYYAFGLTPDDEVRNSFEYLALEYDTKFENDASLRGSLYSSRNRYDYSWPAGMWSGSGNSTYRGDVLGGRLVAGLPLWGFGRLSLGADASHMREKDYGSSVSQPNAAYDVLGLFAEHRADLGDVSTILGVRYDVYRERLRPTDGLASLHTDSRTFHHVSWNAGATWWMLDWLGIKASVATAFVPPTAKERAGDFMTGGSWGTRYVGNRDLNPEKSITGEAGLEADFGQFKAGASYFYTKYSDRIVTRLLPDYSYTWMNSGEQRLAGFNVHLDWRDSAEIGLAKPLEWLLYGNGEFFTERHSRDDVFRTALYVPQYSAVCGAGLGYGMVWLDVNARFTGRQYQDNFTSYDITEMGAFTTWNARLTVRPAKGLSLYLDLSNLTNKKYAYTLDYPMPGRTLTAGFRYAF